MGMQEKATYYTETLVEDAMAVMANWMTGSSNVRVIYHDGTAVDANIFEKVVRIPRMACASGITQEALMLLRNRAYHEFGHIDETKMRKEDYPSKGALFEIWNAVEDRRMEGVESDKHKGCADTFRWGMTHYNKKISEKISSGKVDAPLWEALVAMSFMLEGLTPSWTLSPKSQAYTDAAYSEFSKTKQCRNASESLDLAKVIYSILKQVNEDWKKEQPSQEDSNQQENQEEDYQDSGEQGKEGESKEEEGEGEEHQSSVKKDFDDYENEKNKSGNSTETSEDDSDKKNEGGEDSDGNGDKESEEGESEEESEEESDSSEESGSSEESDSSEEVNTSKNENPNSGKTEEEDTAGDTEEDTGKDGKSGSKQSLDKDKKPVKDDQRTVTRKRDNRDLSEECDGISKEHIQNEDLEKIFKAIPEKDKKYLSFRDNDSHAFPHICENDKTEYKERLSQISVMVSAMTRCLEQALRSMSMCRKNPYLNSGKVDLNRLVTIAKNFSKEVFYRQQDGIKLDVAVAITIDESYSMGCRFYETQLLAMAIGEALNAIGIPFEITGASTEYGGGSYSMPKMQGFTRTNPIMYNHYKLFNEKWSTIRQRMIHTGAHLNYVDGEVIEYAAFRLAQRKERRKVIFSLSDGLPCAGQGNNAEMAANLKRVCERTRKNGIEVFGFGLGTNEPRRYYGEKYFLGLKNIKTMGSDFVREFVRIVTQSRVKV